MQRGVLTVGLRRTSPLQASIKGQIRIPRMLFAILFAFLAGVGSTLLILWMGGFVVDGYRCSLLSRKTSLNDDKLLSTAMPPTELSASAAEIAPSVQPQPESLQAANSSVATIDSSKDIDDSIDARAALLFRGDSLAAETLPPLEVLCTPDRLHSIASSLRETHIFYSEGTPAALSSRLIPHALHQTGKGGLTWESRSWTAMHPDFEHVVWSDASARAMLQQCLPGLLPVWDAVPLGILRSDLLRYAVLFLWGGVWSDADTFPLKPFATWLDLVEGHPFFNRTGLIVGMEVDVHRPDWRDWFARNPQLCQWTMAARPRHPVMEKVLRVAAFRVARLTKEVYGGSEAPDRKLVRKVSYNDVLDSAGPGTWTDVLALGLQLYGNRSLDSFRNLEHGQVVGGEIVVMPVTAFSPDIGHSGSKKSNDPEARVKHMFAGTWKGTVVKRRR